MHSRGGMRARAFLLVAVLFASACQLSQQDWSKLVDSARACQPGDTCVNFNDPCLCPTPVNQREVDTLSAQKGRVVCQSVADCTLPAVNLRCEANRCTGDRPDGG